MSLNRNRSRARDTARDIILGTAPSGKGPRAPRTGVATAKVRSRSMEPTVRRSTSVDRNRKPEPIQQPVKRDQSAINNLQRELANLRQQNKDLLEHEKSARKRLEQNQEDLQRKLLRSGGASAKEIEDLRYNLKNYEGKIGGVNNDVKSLRSTIDKQNHEISELQKELRSRPQVDPNKIANATSQIDGRVRDVQGQLNSLKQAIEHEGSERSKDSRTNSENISRLQEQLKKQDKENADRINSISKRVEADREKLAEENRQSAQKLAAQANEMVKQTHDNQEKLRNEMNIRNQQLEAAIQSQIAGQSVFEKEVLKRMEDQLAAQQKQIEAIGESIQADRNKYKDRFAKVNEALAALEHHLELGNKKMDKIVNSEINARKLHKKGLLSKLTDIEGKLNNYVAGMNKSIEDAKAGKKDVKTPTLDIDALRREMEAIAADKNKLSMEGLLLLEEKMSRIQTGFNKDRRDVVDKVAALEEEKKEQERKESAKKDKEKEKDRAGSAKNKAQTEHITNINTNLDQFKKQVDKLDMLQDDMEKTQDRIRDKVERQIPQDLNELSAKADNIKHQLNTRIDKEEEERYLAIKELQEAFSKLQAQGYGGPASTGRSASGRSPSAGGNAQMKRDVEECKVAIKKLAESITTVKNVLDRKINGEIRQREADVDAINAQLNQPYPPASGNYPPSAYNGQPPPRGY